MLWLYGERNENIKSLTSSSSLNPYIYYTYINPYNSIFISGFCYLV